MSLPEVEHVRIGLEVATLLYLSNAAEILDVRGKVKEATHLREATIRYDLRGRTAGTCMYNRRTGEVVIRFNLQLARNNWPQFEQRTPVHEVAHALDVAMRGASDHGRNWKMCMRLLGATDTSRCHDYQNVEPVRQLMRYTYRCGCPEDDQVHLLTSIKHNRIKRGATYTCVTCGEVLTRDER